MYAIARLNTFDPDKLAAAWESLQQFDSVHSTQPGYIGSITLDLHEGRRLVINVWQSRQHATKALSVLGPEIGKVLNPLMLETSQLLGSGEVISTDLIPSKNS